jgi:hypothetical protein
MSDIKLQIHRVMAVTHEDRTMNHGDHYFSLRTYTIKTSEGDDMVIDCFTDNVGRNLDDNQENQ